MIAYLVGAPRQRQAVFLNIEFTSEVLLPSWMHTGRGGLDLGVSAFQTSAHGYFRDERHVPGGNL